MTRFKTISIYAALIIASLVVLFGISRLERSIESDIKAYHLRFTGEIKNAPGWVSFTTVALGSFRGLLADLLWLHQISLKDQGSYFEMVQLANWITDLQPQFAGSAVYLGWEMAYNLSVTCSNFEDRWRWIQEGLKLLRDKAMIYNPEDTNIYFDMTRIYTEKLGNVYDDAHLFYKNKLFMETTRVMGKKPDWEAMAAVVPNFRLSDWEPERRFNEKFPPKSEARQIIDSAGYPDFETLLSAYVKFDHMPEGLVKLSSEDRDWLNNYLRAAWIWNAFRLNPHRVLAVNREFGDLDWHTCEAQGIYWSYLGLEFRPPNQRRRQLDNFIAISLQSTFRSGRPLVTDPEKMVYYIGVPNFSVVDRTLRAAEEGYELNKNDTSFLLSRNYFLRDAVVLFYTYGQTAKAEEMYKLLKKYDVGMTDSKLTLEQFYNAELAETIRFATVKDIGELLVGMIYRSIHFRVLGDNRHAAELEASADWMYNRFVEMNKARERGVELPPLEVIYRVVIDNFMKNAPKPLADRLRKLMEHAAEQAKAEKEAAAAAQSKLPEIK